MDERERIAAELHEQYRATARRLGWAMKPEVDVEYEALSEPGKELDRLFADWHLARLREARASAEARLARLEKVVEKARRHVGDPKQPVKGCYRAQELEEALAQLDEKETA